MRHLKNLLNPFHRFGGFFAPHIMVLLLVAAAAFTTGLGLGHVTSNHGASFFETRYPSHVLTMKDPHVAALVPAKTQTFSPTATINRSLYPAVGDQGQLGSCAGYATAWALSFEWRVTHPGSWLRFSGICMYSYYSCTYNACQDGGSWPTQDAEFIPTRGIAKFKAVPELSPQAILAPVPGACFNTTYRAPVSFTQIGYGDNEGQGAIDGIKSAISRGLPVLVALPVYPEYDNATITGGLVDVPQPGEVSRGGHENVILAYDDSKFNGRGGVLVQNQWTKLWGLNGRAWLSYDFVRSYVFSLLVPHISTMVPHASNPPTFVPNHAPKHLLEPGPGIPLPPPTARAWYVKNIVLRDTGQNVSGLLNQWGDFYHVSPAGLAATAATESGWRAVADRYGTWPDVSFGSMQFTVSTAMGYHVCYDTRSCKTYLDVPANAIRLAALYYSQAQTSTCVGFPWLYVAYNEGSGYGCGAYTYTHPAGQAATNFYGNFLPNWNVVLSRYLSSSSGYRKVTPKPPFPLALWRSAGRRVSPYYGKHLNDVARAWVPVSQHCRGVTRPWQWHRKGRFTKETFQYCSIYVWSGRRGFRPKIAY